MVILTPEFKIEELKDSWSITNANIDSIRLSKELLFAKGEERKLSRKDRIKFSLEAHANREYGAISSPEQTALIETLYDNRHDQEYKGQIKSCQRFLRKQFEKHSLETLSYITHFSQLETEDKVIHGIEILDQEMIDTSIIGPDGTLTELADATQLSKALLGHPHYWKIEAMYGWLTGKPMKVWRANEKPKEKERKVIAFGTYHDNFYLIANATPHILRPSLGISKSK